MAVAFTQMFGHSYLIGVSAIKHSKLKEQRSVIKFLSVEGEKPCHIFRDFRKDLLILAYHVPDFIAGFREGRDSIRDRPRAFQVESFWEKP